MDKVKGVLIAIFTALSSMLGILAVPMYILIGLNVTDYATGLCAAKYRGEGISSYKGFKGIAKKICMWLLVGLGIVVDWLIMYATNTVGLKLPFTFVVACLAAVWLICNELISILENIADIGVELPPFLLPLVKNIKRKTEDKAKDEPKATLDKIEEVQK